METLIKFVITHYVGFFSFLRYPFRSPVKSRLSKGIFVSIYLNILKKEFFNHFFVLVKILHQIPLIRQSIFSFLSFSPCVIP